MTNSSTYKNVSNFENNTIKIQANQKENSDEREQVLLLKSTFAREMFPNNFDTWTIREQFIWINKNLSKFFRNVPETLLGYVPASFHQINFDRSPVQLPKWMDIDKYRRGQKFVSENYVAIIMGKLIGLIHIYTFNDGLKPVIIGGHGHTLDLGYKRYLSTFKRILSWYQGDPWIKGTQAYKDMQFTHKLHLLMSEKLRKLDNEQIDAASKIAEPWCPDREIFLKDFATACPFEKFAQFPFTMMSESPYRPKGINNMDLASVQAAFVGMFVLRPQDIGVHNATDEDIEAFCHMWRCYGYFLGLEDEHNFFRGSFEEIKQRTQDFFQYWITPNFKIITPEWEHMTRCVIVPMNYYRFIYMPYKAMVLIATDLLDLKMPNLYASLSYSEWIAYKVYTFILQHALKLSIIRKAMNKLAIYILNTAVNYSSEKKPELKKNQ